jgi:hypothetical protein
MTGANENTSGHVAQPTVGMPAGDAKTEQAKINTDFLAQAAEEKASTVHATAIDPTKVKIENEIAVHFSRENQLEVTNAQAGYKYYWAGTAARGWEVTYLLGIRLREPSGGMTPVWEVVKGDLPESVENKDVTGVRRIGDCILMRARMDRWMLWRKWERQRRIEMMDPMASAAEALAAEADARRRGVTGIRLTVNNPLSDPRYRRLAQQAARKGVDKSQLDAMIRDGKLPGFEAGGEGFAAVTHK